MNHRLAAIVVNGLLVALAVVSLGPLLWMLSVSFMQTGEAGHFPPPLLPAAPTLDNYRDLFVRAGMGRYLVNSFIVSTSVMLLSLLFNTMAGYAFAKLRFKGRDSTFRALLAALVIPAQVAMMPLFLLLKQMGLVNTYAGAIVTAWFLSGLVLFIAQKFLRLLGEKGTIALERMMGMVLIMISVQMFMNGLAGYGVK